MYPEYFQSPLNFNIPASNYTIKLILESIIAFHSEHHYRSIEFLLHIEQMVRIRKITYVVRKKNFLKS